MQIDEATCVAADPTQVTYNTARLLGLDLRLNRCAYAEVEHDQGKRFGRTKQVG